MNPLELDGHACIIPTMNEIREGDMVISFLFSNLAFSQQQYYACIITYQGTDSFFGSTALKVCFFGRTFNGMEWDGMG